MCGRFTLQSPADTITEVFGTAPPGDYAPRWNIAPTQPILCLVSGDRESVKAGRRVWMRARWGLVPGFTRDLSRLPLMINARAETVAEKPSFRRAFQSRRCLVAADGYYEWRRSGGVKQAFHMAPPRGQSLLGMAGLFEFWQSPAGEGIMSCTIMTTAANDQLKDIHDRMPALLSPESWDDWLNPENRDRDGLLELLQPWRGAALQPRPVSSHVNNARHEGPQCLEPPSSS